MTSFESLLSLHHGSLQLLEEIDKHSASIPYAYLQEFFAKYIITRNIQDFINSDIQAILPEDFLVILKEEK